MKYKVIVREVREKVVEVTATSADDAQNKVNEMLDYDKVRFTKKDVKESNIINVLNQ